MQKDEIIIKQFVKTIKESSMDVTGDPVILDQVFAALDKKKKKRRFFFLFFILVAVSVSTGFIIWGDAFGEDKPKESIGMLASTEHVTLHIPKVVIIPTEIKKEKIVQPAKKKKTSSANKVQNNDFTNVVSYKFNNHQVDVMKKGTQEFIQINVFGSDGQEEDVLKIMEDLKKSYRSNELYVDTVKRK